MYEVEKNLKKFKKTIDKTTKPCYNIDTIKKGEKSMSIYTVANLDTFEIFTVEASTLDEAIELASKVCENPKILTRNSK